MKDLLERRFRANRGYALVLREQVGSHEAAQLPPSLREDQFYGYLEPESSSPLAHRVVVSDTALLFLTMGREGRLPEYFRALCGSRTEDRVRQLVLDGILEVECEGSFVSGPAARKSLLGDEPYAGRGPLAALSIEALRCVEALGELTVAETTSRLYGFGRRPITSTRKRQLYDSGVATLSGYLGGVPRDVDRYWVLSPVTNAHWVMWRPVRSMDHGEPARFKMYVSPGLDRIAETFDATAAILGQVAGVRGLKLGRGPSGLTRPDKLVAYFSRLDDLHEAGTSLQRRLAGCEVHGVPFTAALSDDGLLSWGADRPRQVAGEPESWRLWIASKLAQHFDTARTSEAKGAQWRFVLDRLRLDGVNTETWAPDVAYWSSHVAT